MDLCQVFDLELEALEIETGNSLIFSPERKNPSQKNALLRQPRTGLVLK